jgi:hypothetical protein
MTETPKVAGYLGYYGLSDWWFNTFSEEERNYINHRFLTHAGPNALIEGTPYIVRNSTHNNISYFLIGLTYWFRKPKDNDIGRRIALKSYELAEDVVDISWSLDWIIKLNYYVRDTVPGALDLVIAACKHQIALAPLVADTLKKEHFYRTLHKHEGYYRYTIILEKNHEYPEVIRLCEEAKKQGWEGDWDKRIERCSKRLSNKSRGRSKSIVA